MLTSCEPSNDTLPVTTPVIVKVLAVCSLLALEALPDKAPLNVVATNLPAVVSKYTPVSKTCVPVLVVALVVPVT